MSLWSRLANVFRPDRLSRRIDDEIQSHIEEAVEHGRDPSEARRAFGSMLRHREESRDVRLVAWLDSLRADAVFGWRQLMKKKVTSAAAILSLALAIGACTSAFRLIDALLLRPLPVANPERLYVLGRRGIGPAGDFRISESCEYPLFRRMRAAVKDQAELIAVSYGDRVDLTFGSDEEMEKAHRQYVSGWMFSALGLRPAAGRLLTENDDSTPGGHAVAVLSHDYWSRRFGKDPNVIGRSFRIGNDLYEIVGVTAAPFTGTEPGTFTDIFVPTMMNPWVDRSDASWFRPLAVVKPGIAVEPLRLKLHAIFTSFQEERAKGWSGQTKLSIDRFLNQTLLLEPAATGASGMQRNYRQALIVLGVLVALVLLIACANVANLMTVQAAARGREMALRVSIGAGRGRLVQMVLVESAWIAFLAAAIGGLFAWQAAPFVVGMINPADNPARLSLPADWRVLAFGLVLATSVTFLFGLAPALRASSVRPASALKGGDDPHSRQRLMHALIALQVAFCFIVHFASGLFVATFDRLANQSTGFSSERLLVLDTDARRPQSPAVWDQAAEHLRALPGVEKVGLAGWPLLAGTGWNGFIWVNGAPTEVLAYFLAVSPGWAETMKIPFIGGRDLRASETSPGFAIVNEAFEKQCFGGQNPVGKFFEKESGDVTRIRFQVVGLVHDARYRNMREPITPTAYVPFNSVDARGASQPKATGAFIVRTIGPNPLAMASILRQEVPRARPELRVSNLRTQTELVQQHTVRERLLAMLALFFAGVALLLAGVGLYGVLDYSVLQRRREIGIRMAIGAPAADIARRVTVNVFTMVLIGAAAGLAIGMTSAQYVQTLLYGVKATDLAMLTVPASTILVAVLLAALPAVIRALRIDPVAMLRSE
jgi:putative ABC transport system permease protein